MDPDIMSELNRKRILDEVKAIRLEKEALQNRGLIPTILLALGNWMVARGSRLHRRYRHATKTQGYVRLETRTS